MTIRLFLIAFTTLLCFSTATPVMGQDKRPSMKWKKMEGGKPHVGIVGKNSKGQYLVLTRNRMAKLWDLRFDFMDSLGRVKQEIPIQFLSPEGNDLYKPLYFVNIVQLRDRTMLLAFVESGKETVMYWWKVNLESGALEEPTVIGKFFGKKFSDRWIGVSEGTSIRATPDDYCLNCTSIRISPSGKQVLLAATTEVKPYKKRPDMSYGAVYFVFNEDLKLLFQGEFVSPDESIVAMNDWTVNDEGLVAVQMENDTSTFLVSAQRGSGQKSERMKAPNGQSFCRSRFNPQADGSCLMIGATKNIEGASKGWQSLRISKQGALEWLEWTNFTKDFEQEKWESNFAFSVKKVLPIPSGGFYAVGETKLPSREKILDLFVIKTDQKGHIEWAKKLDRSTTGGLRYVDDTPDVTMRQTGPSPRLPNGVPHFSYIMDGSKLHLAYETFDDYGKFYTCFSSFEPIGHIQTRKTRISNIETYYMMQDGFFDKTKNEWFMVKTKGLFSMDRYIGKFRLVGGDAEIKEDDNGGEKEE